MTQSPLLLSKGSASAEHGLAAEGGPGNPLG